MNTIEIHDPDDSDALVSILENANSISLAEAINEAPILEFNLPSDDSKISNITKAHEIWLRDYTAGTVVEKFRLHRKQDIRSSGDITTIITAFGLIDQLADELVSDYSSDDLTITQIVTALLALQVLAPAVTVGTINPVVSRSIGVQGDTILRALYRLRDTVGGHVYVDSDRALQWRTTIGEDKGQQIRYRKNLNGITRDTDYSTLANKIYAYGAGEGEAKIKLSDADGHADDFVEDGGSQAEWGGIYVKIMVDKSITHPDTLLAWANLQLTKLKDPFITYQINTVDLSASTDIDFSFEALQIGSTVTVIDEDLGIDVSAQVVSIVHPDLLLHPEWMKLEIANRVGDIGSSLAGVYDTQQLVNHIATEIGAGQVIVKGAFTVIDWVTAGETTIVGSNIQTGTVALNRLDFIPLTSSGTTGQIIATINASAEGIVISADKISLLVGIAIFKQDAIPTSTRIGDLWFDTDDANKLYRAACVGADAIEVGEWELVRDEDIAQALADAATAEANAQTAISDAATAQGFLDDIADDAKITPVEKLTLLPLWNAILAEKVDIDAEADTFSVSKVAYGTAYDTLYAYVVTAQDVFGNMGTTTNITRATWNTDFEAYYNAKIEILNAIAEAAKDLADAAQGDATQALADAATALAVADGEIVGFYQDAEPGADMVFGDIWIDTDGHDPLEAADIYRYEDVDGGSQGALDWRAAPTNAVGLVYLGMAGAQSTADGKIVTFFQAGIPTSLDEGDLWVDTDDKNKLYRAACVGADEIKAGEWVAARDTDIAANSAAIVVTEEDIALNVTAITTVDGRVDTAAAAIIVNADNIVLKVSKDVIVAQINLSAEGIKIAGEFITLDGVVLVTDDLQASNYVAATSGWIIDGDGSAEFNDVTVRGTIYATAGEFTGTLKVTNIEAAKTLTVNGTISAGGGTILITSTALTIKGESKLIIADATGAATCNIWLEDIEAGHLHVEAPGWVIIRSFKPDANGSRFFGSTTVRWGYGYIDRVYAQTRMVIPVGADKFD